MKKILFSLITILLCVTLVGCGSKDEDNKDNNSSNNGGTQNGESVKSKWKNADVKEYELEDFNILTSGIPEPETTYKINVISVASGLSISFESTEDALKYKDLIKNNGFTYKDEIYGMESYESKTHEIQFTGAGIIIDIK